jgi:hypothetical protein
MQLAYGYLKKTDASSVLAMLSPFDQDITRPNGYVAKPSLTSLSQGTVNAVVLRCGKTSDKT